MTRDHFVAECREFLDRNAPRRLGVGGGAPPLGRAALFKSRAEEEATIPAARRYRAAKFDAGTYGTCETCGRPISEERLEAIPYATQCIDCRRRGERG